MTRPLPGPAGRRTRARYAVAWSSLAAVLLGLSGAARAAEPSSPAIPLRTAARLLFATVRINGQGPFNLVLDTGASETVITPSVAARLGLRVTAVTASQGTARAESVSLGNITVRDLPVRVFDPMAARSLRLDFGVDYHGLLGATFLEQFVVIVDYGAPSIQLLTRGEAPARAGGVAFERCERLVRVPVMLAGKGPFAFLLDTGAAETLVFPRTAAQAGVVLPVNGIGRARAATLAVGDWAARDLEILVDSQADPRVGRSYDGILGYPFLSRYRVTLDYPRGRLFLDPVVAKPAR
jgi:predicted aspartyl protease